MKRILYFVFVFLFFLSCIKKDQYEYVGSRPVVLMEILVPIEMQVYPSFFNPMVVDDFLIVIPSSYVAEEVRIYKLTKDGEFMGKWVYQTSAYITRMSIHVYKNQFVFNSQHYADNFGEIISIDMETMTTNWIINHNFFRTGLFGLDEKVFKIDHKSDRIEYYEIDLLTQEVSMIYSNPPVQYGQFVEAQEPFFYKTEDDSFAMLVTTSDESGFILENYNITKQEMIWRISLTEFNDLHQYSDYVLGPVDVQIYDDYIIINSLSHFSVRRFMDQELLYIRYRSPSANVTKPVVGRGVITDSTSKLYCYAIENGMPIWAREDYQDGIWVGHNYGREIYKDYLFHDVPINIHTGDAEWVRLDTWGTLNLDFVGTPGIDKERDHLYYINSRTKTLYRVAMP